MAFSSQWARSIGVLLLSCLLVSTGASSPSVEITHSHPDVHDRRCLIAGRRKYDNKESSPGDTCTVWASDNSVLEWPFISRGGRSDPPGDAGDSICNSWVDKNTPMSGCILYGTADCSARGGKCFSSYLYGDHYCKVWTCDPRYRHLTGLVSGIFGFPYFMKRDSSGDPMLTLNKPLKDGYQYEMSFIQRVSR